VMSARSKGDADTFIGELEQWFDHGMDRASGWYKRKSQALMLPIALVLAVSMNVDSIQLASSLWQNTAQREAIVAMAANYKLLPTNAVLASEQETNAKNKAQPAVSQSASDVKGIKPVIVDAKAVVTELEQLALPIGWHEGQSLCEAVKSSALFGWLITACFVSLGAPFWFNTLGKALSLRAAGNKPPKGKSS